jgi:hypothetical protein
MKKKDGEFLFNEMECERWIEVMIDRAIKLQAAERPQEKEERGKAAGDGSAGWKPTGRGKLFWIDSE